MTFTPASPVSVAAFLLIVAAVLAAIVAGVWYANRRIGGPALRRTAGTALGLAAWVGLTSAVVASGLLRAQPMPRVPVFFAAMLLGAVAFGLSPAGRWLAAGLPVAALVAFQAFRLPLEVVLHAWAQLGTIPVTMTWDGQNLDVVSGVVALLASPFANRWRAAAWVANVVGFALLLNVGRVAMLSSPLPFAWPVRPPLQLIFHLPYALIGPVCVAGAMAGHVVLTRALLRRPAPGAAHP